MLLMLKVLEDVCRLFESHLRKNILIKKGPRATAGQFFRLAIGSLIMGFCLQGIAYGEEKKAAGSVFSELLARGLDPRWSRIFPDTLAAKATLSPVIRELPPPAGPREVQLSGRRAVVSPNIRMHPSSTTSQSEMSVITHPLNPDEVLAGANAAHISISALSQGWYHTTDGGASWGGGDTLPTHTNLSMYMSDPAVGINLDGDLFLNAILFGGTSDIVVARSTDNGSTWSQTAVPSATNGEDKNHLAVDVNPGSPFEGYLYTGYTDFDFSPGAFRFSRSTDAGVSFSAPISISGSVGSQFAQGANLAVGPNGELYATWSGYDVFPPVTTHLGFNKSTDGGVTWQGAMSIRNVFDIRGQLNKGGNFVRVSSFPSMAVDRSGGSRDGWIYIVYAEENPTTPDIFLVRSSDGGATWSAPHKVNQDVSGKDQWFSWVSVDPATGHLYVVYYDSRNFPANDSAQVYISSSIDGGDTFEDLLVSDVAFLPTPIPGLAGGYMGDYIGISALNGVVWPCWNDNRTGIHQAYTSRIVFVEVGSPPKISISPDSLDFGEVYLGYPETLLVSVRNLGFPETLQVSNIVSDNPGFTPETTALVLPGGSVRKLKIAFNPSATGPVTATLTITSNDTANPTVTVALKGTAVYPPALAVSPDSFAFTLNEGDSATATLTIENAGLGTLNFSVAHSFQNPALSLTAKNGIMNFEVRPYPRSENNYSSNAGISDLPAPAAALLRPLMNSAVDSSIRILLVEFGDPTYALLDSLGLAYRLVFPNDFDTVNLNNYDLLLVGSAFSSFDLQHLVNRQPDIAAFINSGGGVVALTEGGADNAWQWLPVPVTGAPFDGNNVHITDPAHPVMDSLTDADLSNWSNSYHNVFSSFSASLNVLALAVEPGNVPLVLAGQYGAGRMVITGLHNEHYSFGGFLGGLRMAGNMIRWASTANWLSENPTTGTVPPGGSANVEVKVKTDQLDGGRFRANILISSNDPANPQDTVPVALHIIGAPNIVLSDDTLDFGDAFIGYPDTLTLRISNNGSDLLEVTAMSLDNPRFSLLDPTVFNVSQNQFRDVRVAFLPIATGIEAGTLSINSTDSTDPIVYVQLLGNGLIPPDIAVSPDSLDADLFTGEMKVETLTISNTGGSNLNFDITTELEGAFANVSVTPILMRAADRKFEASPKELESRIPQTLQLLGNDQLLVSGASGTNDFTPNPSTQGLAGAGDTIRSIPAPGNTLGLTWLNNALWAVVATSPQQIVQLDPNDGAVISSFPIGTDPHLGLTTDGNNLWVCNFGSGTIEEYTPTGTLLTSWPAPNGSAVRGIAWDGSALWIGGASSGTLYRVDTNGNPLETRTLPSALVSWGMDMEWVPQHENGKLWLIDDAGNLDVNQFDVSTNPPTLIQDFPHPDPFNSPEGIAHDGENLWISAFSSGRIYVVDDGIAELNWLAVNPKTGTVPAGFSLDVAVTFDATGLNGGDYFANILVSSNDPDEPQDTTPVHLHVTGVPDIQLSDDSLDFGTPFVGASVVETLVVSNVGTDSLGGNISSDNSDYTVSPSSFSLEPGEKQAVLVTFAPPDSGVSNGNLTITSNDPDESPLLVYLQGRGLLPPDIAVSPDSLADSLFTGEVSVKTLTIANNGYSDLNWGMATGFAKSAPFIQSSPVFDSGRVVAKEISLLPPAQPHSDEVYVFEPPDRGITVSGAVSERGQSLPPAGTDLETVLNNLNADFQTVTAAIPNRFDFFEGEVGNNIGDGGNDMYDGGNFLGTNLGGPLNYSNNVIVGSAFFGGGGRYFTRKYPGLFVLAADMQSVGHFEITGNLGADGSGNADGAILQTELNGVRYLGFVKRVYNAFDPSVNHLVIIEEKPSANHEFSTNTNDDYHRAFNLSSNARLYYLLYAGANGSYIDNNATLNIMETFLRALRLAPSWLSANPTSGTVPAGSSAEVEVAFDATGLNGGGYFANILVSSNDPDEPVDTTPVHLTVIGAPNIVLSEDTLDFGDIFINYPDTLTLTISNNGTDLLEVTGMTTDNPHFSVLDSTVFDVSPGDSQAVRVQFLPTQSGSEAGVLSIASTDSTDPTVYVQLLGNGIHPPVMEVSPDSFVFTLAKGDSGEAAMLISNTGLGTLSFELTSRPSLTPFGPHEFSKVNPPAHSGVSRSDMPPPDYAPNLSPERKVSGATLGVDVLLIQDAAPWSTTANETILQNNGISYDLINSASIGVTDFSPYRMIIVPSDQPQSYYNTVSANQAKFHTYVAAGGVLEFHAAGWGWNGGDPSAIVLPGGMRINFRSAGLNYVLLPSHPVVQGVPSPFSGSGASHAYFTNIPAGTALIVRDDIGGTNLVEYNFGVGKVIASGQTLEYGYANGQGAGIVLRNLIPYCLSIAGVSWLTLTPTSGVVGSGGVAEIQVKVNTNRLDTGKVVRANILVSGSDPANPQDTIPVRLKVIGIPNIVLSDDTLDFGDTFIGYPDTLTLTVSNNGSDVLEVSGISSNNPRFSVIDPSIFNVPPRDSQSVRVQFLPLAVGPDSGVLSVASTDSTDPVVYVRLLGNGIYPPVMEVSPDSFAFELRKGDSTSSHLLINNSGLGTLQFHLQVETQPVFNVKTRPVHQILSGDSSTSQPEKIFRWDWRRASERPISSGHSVQLPTFTSGILLPVIVTDSVGDGGATDIREIAGEIAADHIGFQFVFATLLNPSNFGGVLGLDIDQNSQTGDPLPIGIPQNDVGCEYFASFYSLASNRVDLFNSEGNLVGSFPVSVDAHSFSFALPLSALDNDDGRLNLAAAVGDASGYPTDWIPDTGHGVLQLNWLTLNPYEGTLLAGESLAVEVKVKTDPLSLDSFQAKIRIVSNDPANLLRAVPVSLTVTCTAAKGDMNGDSLLTATDVVLNINCVFLNTGTCSLCFADLNCDGRLSPGDIVLELRAVFLHTPLPCL